MYLDENPTEIPWEAIRYLIADANYGGRVTEAPDNRVLRAYAAEYFSVNALAPKFMLSSLPTYYIPEDNSLASYRAHAKDLPMQELPEAFGQHVNAEIASLIQDTDTMTQIIISMEVGGGGGGNSQERDEQVMKTAESLLDKIPAPMDWEEVAQRNEADPSPLKVCLLQEIERYNMLLVKLSANIKLLIKGIQGFVVISKDQEEVLMALFEGKVPGLWLKSYPSLKPLGSWVPDLIERIEQLRVWSYESIPKAFWLGGLTYPTSFLTGLLQASARKNMVSVDALSFDFIVQSGDESAITALPKEGAYFKNMTLEGAKWDTNANALADAETMALFNPMPIIHFKPVNKKKNLTDGFYQCPLYLYPIRTGSRERPSFMTWVDLKAGQHNGDFWIKRGAALLLSVA
jgi:dynein heavy chain